MASSMPGSPKLPPFGIRDLHGPLFDPGLIQISARAYKATLKSQPDATLLYIDDDDGEQITVGSALELSQRLEDPVHIREQDHRSTLKNPIDGKYVHVFDINKSSASVAVWRDHEAYSSKAFRSGVSPVNTTAQVESSRAETVAATEAPQHTSIIRYEGATQNADFLRSVFGEYGTVKSLSFVKDNSGLASGIVEFGDWTEAEIARCSLDAMHGLSVSKPTAAETSLYNAGTSTAPSSSKSSSDTPPTAEQSTISVNEEESVRFDSEIILEGIEKHLTGLANVLTTAATTLQKAANKTKDTDTSVVEDILTGVKNILTEVGHFGLDAFKALESEMSSTSIWEPNQLSLPTADELASSTESTVVRAPAEDFSLQETKPSEGAYPRVKFALDDSISDVKSVPVLRPTISTPALRFMSLDRDLDNDLNPFTSPKSSKADSILDDDDEDAEFTARYPPLMTVRRSQTVAGSSQKPRYQPYSRRFHSPEPSRRLSPAAKRVEPNEGKKVNTDQTNLSDSVHHSLPGAWPEAKPDNYGPGLPTSSESSGTFFNRMTGRSTTENTLKRANTTAASNPASRLNGPFDPGFAYHSKETLKSPVVGQAEIGDDDLDQSAVHDRAKSDAARYRRPRPIWAQSSRKQAVYSPPPRQSINPVSPKSSTTATRDPLEPFPAAFWRPPPPPVPFYAPPPAPRHHRSVPNVGQMFRHPLPPTPPYMRSPIHVPPTSSAVPQPTDFPEWPTLVPQSTAPIFPAPRIASPEPITFLEPSTEASKYDACVEQLKAMGFDRKINGEHVADRLHVYAVAANGDVSEAVDMINEDREAVKRLSVSSRDYASDSEDSW